MLQLKTMSIHYYPQFLWIRNQEVTYLGDSNAELLTECSQAVGWVTWRLSWGRTHHWVGFWRGTYKLTHPQKCFSPFSCGPSSSRASVPKWASQKESQNFTLGLRTERHSYQTRESIPKRELENTQTRRKPQSFYNLISVATSQHFYHTLFIRIQSTCKGRELHRRKYQMASLGAILKATTIERALLHLHFHIVWNFCNG